MKKEKETYLEAIELLNDGFADHLTDEEFHDLLEALYTSDKFKTFTLWEIVNNAQRTVITEPKDDWFSYSRMLQSKELIYLIYEALELKREEMKGCGNYEN